jgi:hypothetical protein
MRRSVFPIVVLLSLAVACHSAWQRSGATATEIVEGRAKESAPRDSTDAKMSIGLERARWTLKDRPDANSDFWTDVALLDLSSADLTARSVEQRTFVTALRSLMNGEPDAAAVAFQVLRESATDSLVRFRSRIGLTMALSWHSDWAAMSRIGPRSDSGEDNQDRLVVASGVERWARALGGVPAAQFDVPVNAVVLPMRRSAFGTPVITVHINGHPHELWLDTGASMTLLSADIAIDDGLKLAANDTLALGVVAGHVEARAVYVDSLSIGPVMVRGLGAAIVNPEVLRFDERLENGRRRAIPIAGMIGTDVLRQLDVVLDAGAGTITIRRPRRAPAAVRNLFWVGYPVVRLVTQDGRPMLFGLDTGAEGTYVTSTLLRKLPHTRVAARRATFTGLGAEKAQTTWVARDVPLSDGNYAISLRNVPIMPEQRWTFVTFDGVIGSDVALATRMHLDFTNGVFDIRASATLDPHRIGSYDSKIAY